MNERLNAFPLTSETDKDIHSYYSCFCYHNKARKLKVYKFEKEKKKPVLIANEMIIYIENPTQSTKNLQELISKNIISIVINNKITG